MMKNNYEFDNGDNPFALSIGDIMAALLLVFVLILSSILLELEETKEKQNFIIAEYNDLKKEIYERLENEFRGNFNDWGAELDSTDLTIRFNEPDILFSIGSATLKPRFESILSDFFPRYIKVLNSEDFAESIEEIRIEGHTSSEWIENVSDDYAYFENMKLSQDRTRSTLEFSLNQLMDENVKDWTRFLITANGLSSSQLLYNERGLEDKEASRRVEFKIRTDAEERIEKLLRSINE
ncbi:OmpA family protein [Peijinzhouia sedimentorum]